MSDEAQGAEGHDGNEVGQHSTLGTKNPLIAMQYGTILVPYCKSSTRTFESPIMQ